jgi:hypothetical protein
MGPDDGLEPEADFSETLFSSWASFDETMAVMLEEPFE